MGTKQKILVKCDHWTLPSLKEYFDLALAAHALQDEKLFLAMKEAVTKAEIATEKRFETVNEWRNSYGDLVRTYISRNEYETGHVSLSEKVDVVGKKLEKIENIKQGGNIVWVYIVSAISLLVAILSMFLSFGMK